MKPTYNDFVNACEDIFLEGHADVEFHDIDGSRLKETYYIEHVLDGYENRTSHRREPMKAANAVKIVVANNCVGGREGGNVYGDRATRFVSDKEPNTLTPFITEVIKKFRPDIGYLYVVDNLLTLPKEYEYEIDGYYGNYSEYKSQVMFLKELYDKLFD